MIHFRSSAVALAPILAVLSLAACGAPDPEPVKPAAEQAAAAPDRPMGSGLSLQGIEAATFTAPTPAPSPTGGEPPAPEDRAADGPAAPGAASPSSPGMPDPAAQAGPLPQASLIRAQILLDRSTFSPGAIDGLDSAAMHTAISAFQKANGLAVDGQLNIEVFNRLVANDGGRVLTGYAITAHDAAGPFIGAVPETTEAKAALPALGFTTPKEALAEKFHVTEALLDALNPGVNFAQPGQVIVVPALSAAPLAGEVARIEVRKADGTVSAFDAANRLLAVYPATIGSEERPAPSGDLKVLGVANDPDYTYDPARLTYGDLKQKLVVKPGPNNPVGTVWIDLSRDTYGIHGTPDPEKIGLTASNGCVRLTNWDAEQLAAAVKPGVDVRFV